MIVICPTCRAPSNTADRRCWVCQRAFTGMESVIGDMPWARQPLRLPEVVDDAGFDEALEELVPQRDVAGAR